MASESSDEKPIENLDAAFLKASGEARRLEREAIPPANKVFPSGGVFEQFDVEKISIDSYEAALKSAEGIESSGVKTAARKAEKEEKVAPHRIISEEELERIPQEKVEVLTRSEQEIMDEERKLMEMKEKFNKLMSDVPSEKPVPAAPEAEPKPQEPKEKISIFGTPKGEPEVKKEEMPQAESAEETAVDATKVEEIKQLSENFKKISLKKEEMEKQERIRKMKKEIEDMLEGG